jgi:uncharacterized protein (DUF885 family)
MRSLPALTLLLPLLPLLFLACTSPSADGADSGAARTGSSGTGVAGTGDTGTGGEQARAAARAAWPDAAGATADPGLAELAADFWEEILRGDPVFASNLGDDRYLGVLKDQTAPGLAARRERLAALSARAAAIDAGALQPSDRVTLELLVEELQRALIFHDAQLHEWLVDPRGAPHIELQNLVQDQPAGTAAERAAMIRRWAAMPAFVDTATRNLLVGLRSGRVGDRGSIQTTIEQLDRLLASDVDSWPLGNPEMDETVPAIDRRRLLVTLRRGLADDLAPAFARYRQVLATRLLPAARSEEAPGLASLPGGPELYERLILAHTGLPLSAQELHDYGLAEVARIRREIAELGERVLGPGEAGAPGAPGALPAGPEREAALVAHVQQRLRTDPALHFTTRDEVQEAAERALARARAAMPSAFGRLPAARCDVVRVPAHEERDTTIAYYREPAADGSRPGRYYINTFAPQTRPRYEAEVLAFHESIPGHHLQIAIAQELTDLPRFRRSSGPTAYVEGWALYTERLCGELGLYSGDTDRLGVLSFDAWRACRLVVDTGLHAFGWSRQRAIDYLLANTLLATNNIENEVDRYITTPGQALAYKVGQREILALRAEAEAALGPRFDLHAFHDVVLGSGAVSLPVLRRQVSAWIEDAGRP